jgi:hypothetical protein
MGELELLSSCEQFNGLNGLGKLAKQDMDALPASFPNPQKMLHN